MKKNKVYNLSSEIAYNLFASKLSDKFQAFENVEHRLEHVRTFEGINFINDSKSTNVNSTWYSLETIDTNVVLIMGGQDRSNDYQILLDLIKAKVHTIICIGKDNINIHRQLIDKVSMIINTTSMKDAVRIALKMSNKNDTVLLSPACASFDCYDNYEDRGRQFKKHVKDL